MDPTNEVVMVAEMMIVVHLKPINMLQKCAESSDTDISGLGNHNIRSTEDLERTPNPFC